MIAYFYIYYSILYEIVAIFFFTEVIYSLKLLITLCLVKIVVRVWHFNVMTQSVSTIA